jgi:hypothetical protein
MSTVIFETEDAIFQFETKSVMECLEHRKSSYEVHELDTLIEVLSNQPEKATLSSEEHPYIGFIILDLIYAGEGSVVCKNCGPRHYHFNQLRAFTVGPDKATFKAATAKKGGFKNLFRRKTKPPGMQGGKGYKCPRSHTLIFLITWMT